MLENVKRRAPTCVPQNNTAIVGDFQRLSDLASKQSLVLYLLKPSIWAEFLDCSPTTITDYKLAGELAANGIDH